MSSAALSDEQVERIFGALYLVLSECAASKIHIYAGAAGWPQIPDGRKGEGYARAEPLSAVQGWWLSFTPEDKRQSVLRLATVLSKREGPEKVEGELRTLGFGLRDGGFVPVNAQGDLP
jgi:hypothetical protein